MDTEELVKQLNAAKLEASFARTAYDQLVERQNQEIERAKAIPRQGWERECSDGDRILALFPHLQRTEGGWLPVAKIVNEICDLAARCKRAEAAVPLPDDDLTYMKEPLFNARTGEKINGEVRWTIWWNGPDAATVRDAMSLSNQSPQ